MAATRTNGSYLQALYRRLRPRVGHGRALGAVKHSMLCACWHMLSTGELYHDLGGDYFLSRDPERQTRRLVRRLEALGHTVTLQDAVIVEDGDTVTLEDGDTVTLTHGDTGMLTHGDTGMLTHGDTGMLQEPAA